MDNLTALNLIIGFIASPLISMINQPSWSPRARVAVTVAVSIIAGFLTCYFSDAFNTEDVVSSIMTTLVSAIVAYKGIFLPIGAAQKIELKTSPEGKLMNRTDQSG
jgi:small basic protein